MLNALHVMFFALHLQGKVVKENPKLTSFFLFFFLFLSFPGKVPHTLKVTDKHRGERKTTDEVTGRLISYFLTADLLEGNDSRLRQKTSGI